MPDTHPNKEKEQKVKKLPPDIGRRLAELRSKANMSQSAVAPKVRVDQSRISRIETGEVVPSPIEVRTYLEALATEDADGYLRYLEKDWKILPRPAPHNPELDGIWLAEQKLQRLHVFEEAENLSGPVRAEVDMHRQSLRQAAEFLTPLAHQIAFVGDVGVGKTTASLPTSCCRTQLRHLRRR
jgi:transcriptional regulator with XRE-family HTH domain